MAPSTKLRADASEALLSPRRLDMALALRAHGPSTVSELAEHTGMRSTAVYAHLDRLVDAGLVRECGRRKTGRRDGIVYELTHRKTSVRYDRDDPAAVDRTCRYTRMVLRRASAEACESFSSLKARANGKRRDTAVSYSRTWLAPDELARANALLDELAELFDGTRSPAGRQAYALTVALRPAPCAST